MKPEQLRAWLWTTGLTATWAAFLWSLSTIVNGVSAFEDAERTFDETVAPLDAEQTTSRRITLLLADSILPRANRRAHVILGLVPDSARYLKEGFPPNQERELARVAYQNADSARVDSIFVASLRGRPSSVETLWYIGTLETYFGIERSFWKALTDLSWESAGRGRTRSLIDHYFEESHRFSAAVFGFDRNLSSARFADSVRLDKLTGAIAKYRRQFNRGRLELGIAFLLFFLSSVGIHHVWILAQKPSHSQLDPGPTANGA